MYSPWTAPLAPQHAASVCKQEARDFHSAQVVKVQRLAAATTPGASIANHGQIPKLRTNGPSVAVHHSDTTLG